jgi:peroxidase
MDNGGGSVRRAAAALLWVLVLAAAGGGSVCEAQLRRGYYAGVCPNVESIVRGVVAKKLQQTPATVGATVRLFFHDCFVEVHTQTQHLYTYGTRPHESCRS